MYKNITAIILAAGKGERMKSELPKVLHPVCGRPMLGYCLDMVSDLKVNSTVVVVGYGYKEVIKILPGYVKKAVQRKLSGTADAVKTALGLLKNKKGSVLVLYGDNPLLKKETAAKLIKRHLESGSDATILTAKIDKPSGYGRILRDKYGEICAIVEEKDADDFQKGIKEINTGIACFNTEKLSRALKLVRPNNAKKEYYLTDVINIIYKNKGLVDSADVCDFNEALGINSRLDLAKANGIMRQRINQSFMLKGVSIIDPESTFINYDAKIGQDTVIYPFTVIERDVKIGKHCTIGPFAHLRPGCRIDNKVAVGNFIEIVRSNIASFTRVRHFGYIGDSRIGKSVNIGAGTVTANFDGRNKNTTIIKSGAFIGSDTVLVAPVKIGRAAKTGAGSVITAGKVIPNKAVFVGVPARRLLNNKK